MKTKLELEPIVYIALLQVWHTLDMQLIREDAPDLLPDSFVEQYEKLSNALSKYLDQNMTDEHLEAFNEAIEICGDEDVEPELSD